MLSDRNEVWNSLSWPGECSDGLYSSCTSSDVESFGSGGSTGRIDAMDETMLEALSSISIDCGRDAVAADCCVCRLTSSVRADCGTLGRGLSVGTVDGSIAGGAVVEVVVVVVVAAVGTSETADEDTTDSAMLADPVAVEGRSLSWGSGSKTARSRSIARLPLSSKSYSKSPIFSITHLVLGTQSPVALTQPVADESNRLLSWGMTKSSTTATKTNRKTQTVWMRLSIRSYMASRVSSRSSLLRAESVTY